MRHFALIGYPLTHSYSEVYFKQMFIREGIRDASYRALPTRDLEALSDLVLKNQLLGFNVTIPHKVSIIDHLDSMDAVATEVGAVNCVVVRGKSLHGYNTDVYGFDRAMSGCVGDHQPRKALVLGSGGASRAVTFVLDARSIPYSVVSRNGALTYSELNASSIKDCTLIVNTTPLGMYPAVGTYPDIPYEAIDSNHIVMDLVYNPTETAFMSKCHSMGARVFNGLSMLHFQAEKSWEIWNT